MRFSLSALLVLAACNSNSPTVKLDGGQPDAGSDGGSPVDAIPVTSTLTGASLTNPVDAVRDQWGIPHIYGQSIPDVAYAQGYFMAQDRWVELDLLRRAADGSLAGILGQGQLAADVGMRVHHLRATAETGLANLKASTDPTDQLLVQTLNAFAAGVNAWQADLAAAKYQLPPQLASVYTAASVTPWLPEDSVLLGEFLAWQLAFDDQTDVIRTDLDVAVASTFTAPGDPRANINLDLENVIPPDPAVIVPGGWSFTTDNSSARRDPLRKPGDKLRRSKALRQFRHLLDEDLRALATVGFKSPRDSERGSNNWVIGPGLSASGHVLVANDTHLSLQNPPIFYMNHLVARSGGSTQLDVMGEQFPGVPAVTLGMNQHVAWGATVNFIDVTDIFSIAVKKCSDGVNECTTFNGQPVQLVPRQESFDVGGLGMVQKGAVTVTLYDDPNHGPLLPRVDLTSAGVFSSVEPLGPTELSVKYTGYTSAPLLKAIYGLDVSTSMQSAVAALDPNFRYGGQNWVIGDDQGNFGWTQTVEVPLRSPTAVPYKVLPGDGSAEWGPDMDPQFIPHAYNHPQGYISTANNDPIGTTLMNAPYYGQPIVSGEPADGGSHLYLGADYDPGTREGRIETRINAVAGDGGKLSLDDMSSIQADTTSEYGQMFAPTFLDATQGLASAMISGPGDGGPSDVSAYALDAGASIQALFGVAHDMVASWSFDTPSGLDDAGPPTANVQQISDSQAQLVMGVWESYYAHGVLDDELAALGTAGTSFALPVVMLGNTAIRLILHPELTQSAISPVTGDPILFDDLSTPDIIESKRQIAARAVVATLQFLVQNLGPPKNLGTASSTWLWGDVHTLTLDFAIAAFQSLNIPAPTDPVYPERLPQARRQRDGRRRRETRSASPTSPTTTGRRSASPASSTPPGRTGATCCRAARCSIPSRPTTPTRWSCGGRIRRSIGPTRTAMWSRALRPNTRRMRSAARTSSRRERLQAPPAAGGKRKLGGPLAFPSPSRSDGGKPARSRPPPRAPPATSGEGRKLGGPLASPSPSRSDGGKPAR